MLEAANFAVHSLPPPPVRVLLLHGPATKSVREFLLEGRELRVGRPDSLQRDHHPEINLFPDKLVSRRHALLQFADSTWHIKDSGSKHGTFIGGRDIRDEGRVELQYGEAVRTGESVWTVVPQDWWCLRAGDVVIAARSIDSLSYAAYNCGLSLLTEAIVANGTECELEGADLSLWVEGFSAMATIPIPRLERAQCTRLRLPRMLLDGALLRKQTEPCRAVLTVSVNGPSSGTASRDITVLGFWDWSFAPAARRTLAAFVSPRNPTVEAVVSLAQSRWQKLNARADSFRDLVQKREDFAERIILQAVYECMAARGILYEDPHLSFEDAAASYQTIRSPHRIVPLDRAAPPGCATCLDTAVFMAGCLEKAGVAPVIILTGHIPDRPRHALVGCWAGPLPGNRAIIESAELLRKEIAASRLHVVESAGVTSDAFGIGRALTLSEAEARAMDSLASKWVSAINIMGLRPPRGGITPLENPFDPEVVRIYDEAREWAARCGTRHVEVSHLFYGFLCSDGEIARRLCGNLGIDTSQIRRTLEEGSNWPSGVPDLTPTQNFLECQGLAEQFAWDAGSPSVREQDVIWAILEKSSHSAKLRTSCQRLGIDLDYFRTWLARDFPPPALSTTQSI